MKSKIGEIREKWITIKYGYVPKYYKSCKLQGHNEQECFVIHLELYQRGEGENQKTKKKERDKGIQRLDTFTQKEQENPTINNDFQEQRGEKGYGRGRQMAKGGAEKVWYPRPKQTRTNEVTTTNKFGALEGGHKEESHKERDSDKKDEEKGTQVEEQVQDTTQHETNNNKKEVNDTQNSAMDKVYAQSAIKDVVNILDKSEQAMEGMNDKEKETDRETDKGIGEEADTEEHPNVGDSHMGEEENSQCQYVTIPPPKIDKLSEQERIELQEREEDETIDKNIDDIGREGDLSPRQISHLKGKSKNKVTYLKPFHR
uniref:Putative ovule protein n=1 Tax=Solanum chacoense TaxID=4108 RepID=A0A0V0IVW8_SOLCH